MYRIVNLGGRVLLHGTFLSHAIFACNRVQTNSVAPSLTRAQASSKLKVTHVQGHHRFRFVPARAGDSGPTIRRFGAKL